MQAMNFEIENTTWWKMDGSDHFKVRSVIFDENGMQIQTYDGRMVSGDILQEYIQSETPIKPKPKIPQETKINKSTLLQGIGAEELGDVFVGNKAPELGDNLKHITSTTQIQKQSDNDIIISRMVKNLGYPRIQFDINIDMDDNYIDNLRTSASVMGIDMKDIKNYICNNIKDDDIRAQLRNKFSEIFDKYFLVHEEIQTDDEQ